MSRVSQEFYCGECNGYFVVRLNMAINHRVEIICPNCGHQHLRNIVDGVIYEKGRYDGKAVEEIMPTKASYSKKSRTEAMVNSAKRDGVVLADRWLDIAAREKGEDYE